MGTISNTAGENVLALTLWLVGVEVIQTQSSKELQVAARMNSKSYFVSAAGQKHKMLLVQLSN